MIDTSAIHGGRIEGKSGLRQIFRNKAQRAGNGYSLFKRCNAVAGHHSSAPWVGVSVPMDRVAPLGKGMAIAVKPRLAMNADTPTEFVIIMLKEY